MAWGIGNYSTTPGSNTLINGINIAPGCPSSSVGPALRQLMADIASALSAGQFVPTGQIVAFPSATPPTGFLLCDGSAVSRTTYSTLFALIGTTYGAGDGSTTFGVPDLRGRVVAGYDATNASGRLNASTAQGASASTVGNVGGEQAHALAIAELAAHNHTGTSDLAGAHSHLSPSGFTFGVNVGQLGAAGNAVNVPTGAEPTNQAPAHQHTFTSANTGSGTAHNVVQPTIIMAYCIKT